MTCFPSLFGNDASRARLGDAIERGVLPHALMLIGPSGSGKRSFAHMIAAALGCEAGGERIPCGECPTCKKIMGGFSPDVSVLSRQDRATIGVGAVRQMREDMHLSATELPFKLYIVDDMECMTEAAQNVLLIGIEEPPPNVYVLLLTENAESILETVKSRVQSISMQSFRFSELIRYFKENPSLLPPSVSIDSDELHAALMESGGTIGGALDALTQERMKADLTLRSSVDEAIDALTQKKRFTQLHSALSPLSRKGISRAEYAAFLSHLRLALRDLAVRKRAGGAQLLYYADGKKADELAESTGLSYLLLCHDIIADAEASCLKNANLSLLTATLENDLFSARGSFKQRT